MTKKFRIWDGEEFYFTTDEVNIYPAGFSSNYGLFFNMKPNKRLKPNNSDYSKSRQITIQQWTGLTDSQGVEIYEGDIVTYSPQLNSIEAKCEVVSCVGGFRLARLHSKKGVLLGAFVEVDGKVDSLKVIGNIFQNPELLEKC